MDFVLSPPVEIHTIDVNDTDDPSVLQAIPEDTYSTSHIVDDAASSQGALVGHTAEDESDAGSGEESDEQSDEESDEGSEAEGGDESSDESGDDESGDESSDDSSDEEQGTASVTSEKDDAYEDSAFEYAEVIDDGSKAIPADAPHDEDLGGEAVAAASAVAGVTALSSMRLRRNLIVGVILTALGAAALYYLWRKMQDMKKKISQLEQQQEMGLNDRDVQFISSQVLEDYLQQEVAREDAARVADKIGGEDTSSLDEDSDQPPTVSDGAADETSSEGALNSLDTIPEGSEASETLGTLELESGLAGDGDAASVTGAADVSPPEVCDTPHAVVAPHTDELTEEEPPADGDPPQQPSHEDVLSDVGGVFDVPAGALVPEPSDGAVDAKEPKRRRSRREKKNNQVESHSK